MLIDYKKELNAAQYEAVTFTDGPLLVIAGAGSGKTRTIVYRLAYLVEQGIPPASILLLTFTRKASQEMLSRAGELLGMGMHAVRGGTFHSLAFSLLRRHAHLLGYENGFTVLDRADAEGLIKQAKEELDIARGDRSFPKKSTVLGLLSQARNKELPLEDILKKDAGHLGRYSHDLLRLGRRYEELKKEYQVFDYDDLLFVLEELFDAHENVLEQEREAVQYIMVDEYQDTNRVQARLVRLLAGEQANVMAVGDDAQSIYAFRGANIQNIFDFPEVFPQTRVIKLEQNYRSVQPVLSLTNAILDGSDKKYAKKLFSQREGTRLPELIRPLSDSTEARLVVARIAELEREFPLHEIAVLFRAGYHSYALEVELNKAGIRFQKYGGLKFSDAAHIKDALAFIKLVANPLDLPSFRRAFSGIRGVGNKSCENLFHAVASGNQEKVATLCRKNTAIKTVMNLLDSLREIQPSPVSALEAVYEYYKPLVEHKFPDDFPRRLAGLDELAQIASPYKDIETFLADLTLDNPDQLGKDDARQESLVLSTVHSAKGLEWSAVMLINLVEDRFPAKHAMHSQEEFEEERRLLYVACTRARDYLGLFMPCALYNRYYQNNDPAMPCPFLRDIPSELFTEFKESYAGHLTRVGGQDITAKERGSLSGVPESLSKKAGASSPSGKKISAVQTPTTCWHKIFGRGKIVEQIEPDKYKINFPGFGLKVIVREYVDIVQE